MDTTWLVQPGLPSIKLQTNWYVTPLAGPRLPFSSHPSLPPHSFFSTVTFSGLLSPRRHPHSLSAVPGETPISLLNYSLQINPTASYSPHTTTCKDVYMHTICMLVCEFIPPIQTLYTPHTHTHTHTYIYTDTDAHIETKTNTHSHSKRHRCTYRYTHVRSHAHTYRYTHVRSHAHTYRYTHVRSHLLKHTHIQTKNNIHTHTNSHTQTYTYKYKHMHTDSKRHTHTHTFKVCKNKRVKSEAR